jgi:hypothetical protein
MSLVADMQKICRPDLILYCRGHKPRTKTEELKLAGDSLKPASGVLTIYGEIPEGQEQDGDAVMVGFEHQAGYRHRKNEGSGYKENQPL